MAKTRRKDGIFVIKAVTVMMFLAIMGVIIWTSVFISQELSASSASILSQGASDKIAAEGPNLKLFQDIEAQLEDKVAKPLPNAAAGRNPFFIPGGNPNPVPTPVQPPIVEPPAEPEMPSAPPTLPTPPVTPPPPETPTTTP